HLCSIPAFPTRRSSDLNYAAEKQFLIDRKIGVIVSRNSGGTISYAKIEAARTLGLPVMMISRPPVAARYIVTSPEEAIAFARTGDRKSTRLNSSHVKIS